MGKAGLPKRPSGDYPPYHVAMSTVAGRVAEAAARQQQWELDLANILEPPIVRFLHSVISAATSALDAPTLLAAADPFAFTNIRARWDTAVRLILHTTPASKLAHPALLDEQVARTLRAADLPDRAAGMAVDLLVQSRDEGWSKTRTKRALRAAILPPAPRVEDKTTSGEWSWYKARVRAIARTAATRAQSLYTLEAGGFTHKRWTTQRDRSVRESHAQAHSQTVGKDDAFMVGGYAMQYPGDLTAPPELTHNCRCLLIMVDREEDDMPDMPDVLVADASTEVAWAGPIAFEGVVTGDGRMVAPGAWFWDEPPYTLRHVPADYGEHAGAVAVGRVDRIERRTDGVIWGEGVFDLGSEQGREAARLVRERITTGISVDPDDVSYEVRVKADLIAAGPVEEDLEAPGLPLADGDGMIKVMEYSTGDELMVFTRSRIRAVTLCDIPAFSRAKIELAEATAIEPVLASAASDVPPAWWFEDPKLDKPTRLTITDDGRVFGHIALWETCHTGFPGQCVPPPHSPSNYAAFHNSPRAFRVRAADGTIQRIAVGKLTAGTGHAKPDASPMQTIAHYDNTGTTAAFTRAGEDTFGIWVAGIVRPGATEDQILTLETSPPSGDWRNLGQGLDLLAVLCVNTPGYPVPLVAGAADRDGPLSLVAAGAFQPELEYVPAPEIEYVRGLMRADAAAHLASRITRARAKTKVHAMAAARRKRRSRGALSLQER